MDRVLIVERKGKHQSDLEAWLQGQGFFVACADSMTEGVSRCREFVPELVFVDAVLAGGDGVSFVRVAKKISAMSRFVVMCPQFSPHLIFEAIAQGAYDCLEKPLDGAVLIHLLAKLEMDSVSSVVCKDEDDEKEREGEMVVGSCPKMIQALKMAGSIAATRATVLIRGESGTGKELMARAIHQASGRTGRFVAINCAALPDSLVESELFGHERGAFTGAVERRPGCFEQADGGTLFLDEIGDAPVSLQAKLLRVLDRGEFCRIGGRTLVRADVRVIAATNTDLEALVDAETFRLDLFYRLSEVSLGLPALRERRGDLPKLVRGILKQVRHKSDCQATGVSSEAMEWLMAYDWPGNLRELQNVLHRAALVCKGQTIQTDHLDLWDCRARENGHPIQTLQEVEQSHISQVLVAVDGNRGRACELLGITRPTLRRKMRRYAIEDEEKQAVLS